MITSDGLVEKALREQGVFPPSVLDPRYGDRTEMTRAEIILRSLEEMGLLPLPEQDPLLGEKIGRIRIAAAALQGRLPDGGIATCAAFRDLGVGCCDTCHTDPAHGMWLVELRGGGWAWLCCQVEAASSTEPYLFFHERWQDTPEGKAPAARCGRCKRRAD